MGGTRFVMLLFLCLTGTAPGCAGQRANPLAHGGTGSVTDPEADADGDGIRDLQDRCLREPEDRDGFEDQDGCPDLDNDGDDIPDACDACPNEPETLDCPVADGCPGSHCQASGGPHRRVTVLFDKKTAPLPPSARKTLNEIAAGIEEAAQLYICSACGRGKLFLRRVRSIRNHLQREGVPSSRIHTSLHCRHKIAAGSVDLYIIRYRRSPVD